jgi:cytochrome c-type biogenesis protein CcmH/NrfG
MMAKIYMEQGKLDEALAQLNAALRIEPASAQANLMLQQLNSRSGR